MVQAGLAPAAAKVGVLGLTFKEDCPDVRNSKVADIINRMTEYGISPIVSDPWADEEDARRSYGIDLVKIGEFRDMDCVIVAVAHSQFCNMDKSAIHAMFSEDPNRENVLIDVKGIFDKNDYADCRYWRL